MRYSFVPSKASSTRIRYAMDDGFGIAIPDPTMKTASRQREAAPGGHDSQAVAKPDEKG